MKRIDINVDLGENYNERARGNDALIIPLVSSVNIACGFHAGDYKSMAETIILAKKHGVHIGAHPGYPDKEGFGRRDLEFSLDEIRLQLLYQIGALESMLKYYELSLHHVKPHGALYNEGAKNYEVAKCIAETVALFGDEVILIGLSNSQMEKAAKAVGIKFWGEGFADRRYQDNGLLVPRSKENALIRDIDEMMNQVIHFANKEIVQTICIHGDSKDSVALSKRMEAYFSRKTSRGQDNDANY